MKKLITLALMLTAFCGVSMATTYTVVGNNATIFEDTWAPTQTANDMALVSGSLYRKTYSGVSLTAGTLEYKIAEDHAWSNAHPSGVNTSIQIPFNGTYDVVFEYTVGNDAGTCELILKSNVYLIYNSGSGWKVGDKLSYNSTSKTHSLEFEGSKEMLFAFTTKESTKGDSYSSWDNSYVVRPNSANNYDVYIERMAGSTNNSSGKVWFIKDAADYTITWTPASQSFVLNAEATITVNASAGWATFSLGSDGNDHGYTVSGADAFYVASTSDGKAVLTSIASGKKIPTYPNGIMLKKIGGGDVTITTTEESDVTLTDNMLQGSGHYSDWDLNNSGYTGYYLYNGASGLGFYPANTGNMSPYKAFLRVPTGSARDFFSFEEETTGIKQTTAKVQQTNEYFNLAGQRVAQPTKGLYIVNGKKVIMK